jgi:TonB family protein
MPTIFQLPPLYEEAKESPASSGNEGGILGLSSNGKPPELQVDDFRTHKNPFALLEAEIDTERARLRLREALWISIILHAILALLVVVALPKLLQRSSRNSPSIAEMLQQHDLTYLTLPPSKPETPPKETTKISDQNRRAAMRHPDQKTLQELRDAARAGAPGANQPASAAAQPPGGAPSQSKSAADTQAAEQNQTQARLEPPPASGSRAKGAFSSAVSPGSAIEQAARASAERHGAGGDFGAGPSQQPTKLSNFADVLSDTMGVDFGPYLARVLADIRRNWYNVIPEAARPPLMEQGTVSIDFVIQKNGSVAGLKLMAPSGDVSLDRAAWGGITASNPFPPLPTEFRGQYLALRLHFLYNPDRSSALR